MSGPDITTEYHIRAHALVSIRPDIEMLNDGKFDAELYAFMSHAPDGPASLLTMWHECATFTLHDPRYPKKPALYRRGLAHLQALAAGKNLRWTAFGPTNAKLHRVNVAVTLGDTGTAVDVARGIDLSTITVTERKATLLIDTARAFLQWGRHEKAYITLRTAEEIAHEEIAGRPSVHRLVCELATSAPPTVRRDATQSATRIGISR